MVVLNRIYTRTGDAGETALGDGVKKVYESELAPMKKLRRVAGVVAEEGDRELSTV